MEKISFTDATAQLRRFLSSKGPSENTFKAYLTDVRMFWEEMELGTGPNALSLDDLEVTAAEWLTSRRRVMAPKTTARRLTSLRNLGFAYKMDILSDYRLPTAPTPKPHPLPGGPDDIQKLLDLCSEPQHLVLISLTGLCGARISEARDVKPTDINYAERTVTFWGKGNKIRHVPISDFAWEILLPIFVSAMVTDPNAPVVKMGDRGARSFITMLGERARMSRPISSHDLRATFATHAFRCTLNIRAVQELLGHATTKQTELYIGVDDKELRAAVNIMGVR